jgi:2-succinyl-5-enolpyruvyl-6-hydroxy-3-cyclohexene-1-carboxylate synthase
VVNAKPEWLITKLAEASCFSPVENNSASKSWFDHWIQAEAEIKSGLPNLISVIQWSDLSVTAKFLQNIPKQSILFLGNSMPIRYALWLSEISSGKQLDIYTNRGTSGIDGCLSTAIGIADAQPEKQVFVLIGDMGFLYDRNAFWTNKIPDNLKVLVLNNGGGNIFRILPSSSGLPEMADYFEMNQTQTSEGTCLDAGIMRFTAKNEFDLESVLPQFFNQISTSVLEVFTDKEVNHSEIQKFRSRIRQVNGK